METLFEQMFCSDGRAANFSHWGTLLSLCSLFSRICLFVSLGDGGAYQAFAILLESRFQVVQQSESATHKQQPSSPQSAQ